MIAHAKGKYIRVSPVKVRQIIDLIRGKQVLDAVMILTHLNKGATPKVLKVLNSAMSNARQKGLTDDQLYVSKIYADQGAVWKRFRAAAFGRATRILKKTTHVTVELDLITS